MGRGAGWAGRLASIALGLFVLGPLLAHVQAIPALAGFGLFALGGILSLVALIASIIKLVRAGAAVAMRPLAVSAVLALIFVMAAMPGRKVPRINDITTDTQNPPQFVNAGTLAANAGRDMAYPPDFAEQQRAGYPDLQPLALPQPPDEAFRRVEAAAKQVATWEVTRIDQTTHVLEGIDTSYLFRFRDDFVIEVRPAGQGSIVHMRSKSRDGKGDVGANAARIEAFLARLRP